MIIALLALAFAMIVGGLLAVFTGWDIVLVERGWTMVIAGSVMAASGALLLGITAAVSRLSKIQAELARLQGGLGEAAPAVSQPASTGLSLAALSGGLLDGNARGEPEPKPQDNEDLDTPPPSAGEDEREEEADEPSGRRAAARLAATVLPFSSSRRAMDMQPARDEDEADLKVPDFLLSEREQETTPEDRISEADESLYEPDPVAEEREAEHESGEALTPAVWPEASDEPREEEQERAPEKAEPEEPRAATVIGTYNSGDNKYVMFSDGSIEAQTPKGIFHFKSLDELKAFIAAGGESNSSAAI